MRQGITVDRFGISVTSEPKWWFRGRRAHVLWADVHHIAVSSWSSGRTGTTQNPLIQVHLNRVDHEFHLPWQTAWRGAAGPSGA